MLFRSPVCREENISNTLKFLSASGIKLVAATEKGADNYTSVGLKDPIAIVLGSEDEGIASEHLRQCHELVQIPMLGTIGSLNVSVAAGVLLYEVIRQRTK